jgi:hypothetical protein
MVVIWLSDCVRFAFLVLEMNFFCCIIAFKSWEHTFLNNTYVPLYIV